MKKLYIIFRIWAFTVLSFSMALGQAGIVLTERSEIGLVSFTASSKLTNIGDGKHVDGYVKKYGDGRFVFPVGHNGSYRPFAAEATGTIGAYFKVNPESATLPAGAPFRLDSRDAALSQVSNVEYWDIDGGNATKITFTWNAGSQVSSLTSNSVASLTIAGWNSSTSKWEKISSLVDEISVLGSPSTVNAGSITSVGAIIPDNYKAFTLAKSSSVGVPSKFTGSFEVAGCTEIKGWVWDESYPNSNVTVELLEGNTVLAVGAANQFRQDLKDAGIGSGNYGFSMKLPLSYLGDGITHSLSIRVQNSTYVLNGSPKTTSCSYGGKFEEITCKSFKGWSWNQNSPAEHNTVELYQGNTVIASVTANNYREDLKQAGVGNGDHGFSAVMPVSVRDNVERKYSVRIAGLGYVLEGSEKALTCPASTYSGIFEVADCNSIRGWIWDKKYPDEAQIVEVFEGNTVYATGVANIFREAVKNAGYGTGNYGFNIPIPALLKDGKAHQLSVRVKGSSYVLSSSPRTLNCAVNAYFGSFGGVDCNTFRGWVWDKNNPAAALEVELFEGSTVYASGIASTYDAAVKNAGYGTGNYGFAIPIPASLKDGKAHQLSVRVKGSSYVLSSSPRTLNCAVNAYFGSFGGVDCNTSRGWVWDKNNPAAALEVELFEGSTVYASGIASTYDAAVKNAGYGTGNYGFAIPIPASLKDGKAHQLGVRVKGSSYVLTSSPRTLNCAVNAYFGSFGGVDCNTFRGWVWDKNNPAAALEVELFEGSTVYASGIASTYDAAVKNAGYGTGNYGFAIPIPASLKDGKPHQLSVRVKGSSYVLTSSPRALNCAVNAYFGSFGGVDCNTFRGWVWDKNNPAAALEVELFEGSTVYASGIASNYDAAVKNAGYGTGNYGFAIPIPASLKDGKPHQLSVRVKGTSYVLTNSPRALNCAVNAYFGSFGGVDCNTFRGWVWDKNNPATALEVELFEGSTVYASGIASNYDAAVKNAGYGTGNYGFAIPIPASLKDGKPHQLSVRVKGTSYVLTNSPRALNCAVNAYFGSFDGVDCKTFRGWAWDKNNPAAALEVELFEGSVVYGTAIGNTYKESVKNAGYGTGNYAFNLPIPASLKDGKTHQLSIRVKGTSYTLINSPRVLTCASIARLAVSDDKPFYESFLPREAEQLRPDAPQMSVWPNPTRGKVTVEIGQVNANFVSLSLLNLGGNILWKEVISERGTGIKRSLDLSLFPSGTYILKLVVDEQIETKRVISLP